MFSIYLPPEQLLRDMFMLICPMSVLPPCAQAFVPQHVPSLQQMFVNRQYQLQKHRLALIFLETQVLDRRN